MRKLVLVCFLSLLSASTLAALDLELTQGVDGALPIAIVPFGGEGQLNSNDLTSVIARDLRNSGHFKIIDAKKGHELPSEFSQANVKKWRKLGLDNLVMGSVTKKTNNKFSVSFQLANLYASKSHEQTGSVLLSKSYTLNENSMRALGHHIADEIFQKLLGKKGVFSTHISYVLVKQHGKKHTRYHLMVSDIDGANQQALATSSEPVMSPAWSPDGRRIAYVSFEGHKAAIYVQTVLSGRRVKIASFPGINGAPAWAPDGKHLALVLSKTGYPKIYTLNLKTKKLTQLTDGWAIDTEPSYSPDGQSIVFTSSRGGGPQIYQVPAEGGRAERITFSGPYNATASYTKDGSALVLLHKENGEYHIAVQDMSTGQLEILTDSGKNQSPSLAPNDEMVVFATKFGRKQVLGMVSRDARIRLRLPAGDGDVREPAWSPT